MGLIFDVAVVAIAAGVIGALALLTWTLAVNAVRAVDDGRAEVGAARRRVADAEVRIQAGAPRAYEALARMIDRTS